MFGKFIYPALYYILDNANIATGGTVKGEEYGSLVDSCATFIASNCATKNPGFVLRP
jgi:hypothetical protein